MLDEASAASGVEAPDAGNEHDSGLFEVFTGQPLETLQERLQEVATERDGKQASARVLVDAGALARAIASHTQRPREELQLTKDLLHAFFQHLECVHKDPDDAGSLARIRDSLDSLSISGLESIREPVIQALAALSHSPSIDRVAERDRAGSVAVPPPVAVVSDPCTGLPLKDRKSTRLNSSH